MIVTGEKASVRSIAQKLRRRWAKLAAALFLVLASCGGEEELFESLLTVWADIEHPSVHRAADWEPTMGVYQALTRAQCFRMRVVSDLIRGVDIVSLGGTHLDPGVVNTYGRFSATCDR